jgi:hypothetical protein
MSTKPSQLTVATTVATSDTVPYTSSPASSPSSKRITFANLITALANTIISAIGGPYYIADGGTANARTATCSPAITSLTTGLRLLLKSSVANTGATTLAVNGLTAKAIKKSVSTDLGSGDIALGAIYEVVYDGTNFQLISR